MRAHGVSSLALVLVCATTGHAVGDMVDNDEREQQILSCPPATTSHHTGHVNGEHCVCLPGFACVEPETGGRFDHCSHGHEVGGSLTVPAAHRNLSGYRHRKCPSCRCDPRKTQVQGAPAAVVKSTSDDCRWEALRSGTRDSQTDNDTSRCSLPTTLGSLDLGFTLVEIEPCRIDPGPVPRELREGGGDCLEDPTCMACRSWATTPTPNDHVRPGDGCRVRRAYRNVTRQRARRRWFEQAFGPASERSDDEPIYVLMVNDGEFGQMALNWFAMASARGIPGLVSGAVRSGLIYGIDDEIVRKATSRGIPAFPMDEYDAHLHHQGSVGSGVKRWVWPLMVDLLSAGYSVVFMDADALLLQPLDMHLRDSEPHPIDVGYFYNETGQQWQNRDQHRSGVDFPPQVYAEADVLAQHEMQSSKLPDHGPLNTGVVFFRAGCRALMLAETFLFLNVLEMQTNGQYWFNHILKSPRLAAVQVGMFSRKHVTSVDFSADGKRLTYGCQHASGLPDQLVVAHFQVGHKIKRSIMKDCGLWSIHASQTGVEV